MKTYLVITVIIKQLESEIFEITSVGGLKISPVSRAARKVSVQGHSGCTLRFRRVTWIYFGHANLTFLNVFLI